MKLSRVLSRPGPGLLLVAVFVATVLGPVPASKAGLVLGSSSGSTFFAVFGTAETGGGLPVFNPDGTMLTPGSGVPILTGGPIGASQVVTSSTLSPFPGFTATANPNSLNSNFGAASTNILALTSGSQGGFTTQGGVFYGTSTSLKDNLNSSGQASVSVSTGTAIFTNTTPGTVIALLPGGQLSVKGTLGDTASYVAAGLSISMTLSGTDYTSAANPNGITSQLDSIAMAGYGSSLFGSAGAFASKGIIPNTGSNANAGMQDRSNPFYSIESASASYNSKAGILTGTGTSFNSSFIVLGFGDSVTLTGVLTLISDPGSSINVDSDPDFDGAVPTFGVFAGDTPNGVPFPATVPEPSTVLLLGSGLAMAGLWSRSSRRRISAGA